MADLSTTIPANIRKAREAKGWSKSELGRQIGSGYLLVHLVETGKQMPTLPTLERFAAALGLPVSDLIGRTQT